MGDLWAIVLAGGCGKRLEGEAVRRYGYPRPKQFCDFDGTGTLLQQTLDRALLLIPEDRIVVVTSLACRQEARESLAPYARVVHVEQPAARDTAPGLLLPLLEVLHRDPEAVVAVLPSDHHVTDARQFMVEVEGAGRTARAHPSDVVLLGASPSGPEEDYGWVIADGRGRVIRFVEKPDTDAVSALIASGARVNTFVMVGTASAFASLFARWVPRWWRALTAAGCERALLDEAYAALPSVNFSHAVLELAIAHLRLHALGPVGWTDVGTPDRLRRSLSPDVAAG